MTILLDEGVPIALGLQMDAHAVETVGTQGWRGIKNGSLLKLITQYGFEVFITADKNLTYQQTVTDLPFAVLVLSTNHWPTLRKHVTVVREAADAAQPGQVVWVECGRFVPGRKL